MHHRVRGSPPAQTCQLVVSCCPDPLTIKAGRTVGMSPGVQQKGGEQEKRRYRGHVFKKERPGRATSESGGSTEDMCREDARPGRATRESGRSTDDV